MDAMHGSDRDGQELREALGRAVGGAAPDLATLVADAAAEGRAIRRRRRAATAAAVTAVGALAVGGLLVLPHAHPKVPPAATAAPRPPGPAIGTTAPGTVPLTGQAAVGRLIALLPPGSPIGAFSGSETLPGQSRPEVRGEVTYDGGHGSAVIGLAVEPGWSPDPNHPSSAEDFFACAARGPLSYCRTTVLPDGGRLVVWEGKVFSQIQRGVDLLRADGVRVTAGTTSLMDARRETVLTEQPPLGLEQLEAIVRDPGWTARIDGGEAARAAGTIVPYTDKHAASAVPTP